MSQNTFGDGRNLIVEDDPLRTLVQCEGYYRGPCTAEGQFLGPLVGYAGTYPGPGGAPERHFVGNTYFNFSQADQWPAVLRFFALKAFCLLDDANISPSTILGAPMAGLKFSQELARLGWTEKDLVSQRKNAPQKLAIAARLRKETILPIKRIAARVGLGTSKGANRNLHSWMQQAQEQEVRGKAGEGA